MNRRKTDRGGRAGPWRLLLAASALIALPQASEAGLTLTSSSGFIFYALDTTTSTGVSGAPQFDPGGGGGLVTPGGGLPGLTGTAPGTPTEFASRPLDPPFDLVASTSPQPNVTGTVPPKFGSAETAVFAQGLGSQGSLLSQGGVFWDNRTFLADGLALTDRNLASVSFSSATATFTNLMATDVFVTPGSIVSVRGTVGATGGSYVAASLLTRITLSGGPAITLAPIVLGASQGGLTVNQAGGGPNDASSVAFGRGQLFGTATSTLSNLVDVRPGQSITVQAMLTLIADPMSSIQLVSDLAPGFPFAVPDFGAYAGGPAFTPAAVPEPSAAVLVGLGLASVGAWRARRRAA